MEKIICLEVVTWLIVYPLIMFSLVLVFRTFYREHVKRDRRNEQRKALAQYNEQMERLTKRIHR